MLENMERRKMALDKCRLSNNPITKAAMENFEVALQNIELSYADMFEGYGTLRVSRGQLVNCMHV